MNILLVEDDLVSQTLATQLLSKWGMEVTVAHDGMEALQAIRKKVYNLVIMDINMPLMDGCEVTRLIRAEDGAYFRTIPILAYSASTIIDTREKAEKLGMNDFVSKPLSAPDLHCKINQYALPSQIKKRDLNITLDLYAESEPEFKAELVSLMITNLRELQHAAYKSYYTAEPRAFNTIYRKVKSTIILLDDAEFNDCLESLIDGFANAEKSAVLQHRINMLSQLSEGIIKSLHWKLAMCSAKG